MTRPLLLEARDLHVRFGGVVAVDGVELAVAKGGITAIIGPNGAGKSTLFNVLSGRLRPRRGSLRFRGREVTGWPHERLCRFGLGRSFQISSLFEDLTVLEHLRLACQIHEPPSRWLLPPGRSPAAMQRARALALRLELDGLARLPAGELSHGDQRRLEIALALACDPVLLLLDEPTQGMSATDTARIGALVRELAEKVTILLIEHDIGLVMGLADRIVVLHEGRIIADGTPEQVRADTAVRTAYLGEI